MEVNKLAPRKASILTLMVNEGLSAKAIAYRLGLTLSTVHTYTHKMSQALGLCGRNELVSWAIKNPDAWAGVAACAT